MKNKTFFLFVIFLFAFQSFASAEVKTYVKEYTYQASEDDSRNSSRVTAMREVKRLLLEELGTYLESVTEVKNFQLTKDQITALTAGIVKTEIVNEKWDGHTYWIKTKIVADEGDVIKSIDNLRKDRDKSRDLVDIQKRADVILEENKKLRAELRIAKGEDKEKQKRIYEKSIKELSSFEWFESGIRNRDKGDYNAALHDFSEFVEMNPSAPVAYLYRGNAYYSLTKYNEAIVDFSKAIDLHPKFLFAYIFRGNAYANLNKYNEAIIDYNKSIGLIPKDWPKDLLIMNILCRGIAYLRIGKYTESIIDFDKAIKLNPKTKSIQDLSKAIKINPAFRDSAKTEPFFDNIRNSPEFLRLMSK